MSVVYYHMWYWDLCHDSTTERGDRQPMVDHYAADIDMFDLIKLAHFSAWALQMILRSVTWLVVTCLWLTITGDINISDVIGCHLTEEPAGLLSGLFWSSPNLVVRYISKGKNYKWTAETVQVTGSKEECEALQDKINEKLGQGERKNNLQHIHNHTKGKNKLFSIIF